MHTIITNTQQGGLGAPTPMPTARYVTQPDGHGFYEVIRCAHHFRMSIGLYTDPNIAQQAADFLNTLVTWEAP